MYNKLTTDIRKILNTLFSCVGRPLSKMNAINTNMVYLQTGTNIGERFYNLEIANRMIEEQIGRIVNISSIYETDAWGITDQPLFLNQVLEVKTDLSPNQLMDTIFEIEAAMGRIRFKKWAERLIDIDILFYNDAIIDNNKVIIPHPRITERNFVLVPLAEIAAGFIHPIFKKTITTLLQESIDDLKVRICEYERV